MTWDQRQTEARLCCDAADRLAAILSVALRGCRLDRRIPQPPITHSHKVMRASTRRRRRGALRIGRFSTAINCATKLHTSMINKPTCSLACSTTASVLCAVVTYVWGGNSRRRPQPLVTAFAAAAAAGQRMPPSVAHHCAWCPTLT